MTRQLTEQRERLVQSERVAAWRELARRLAHELKNPLFPLQITVENMRRARDQYPEQFDEVFREGSDTLPDASVREKWILATMAVVTLWMGTDSSFITRRTAAATQTVMDQVEPQRAYEATAPVAPTGSQPQVKNVSPHAGTISMERLGTR